MIGSSVQSNIKTGIYAAVGSGNLTDKEGYLVKFTGSMSGKYPIVAIVSAGTDAAIGVLEAGATTGKVVYVRPITVESTFRCVAAASITVGELVTATSAGKVQPANAGDTIIGRAEQTVTVSADAPYVEIRGPVSGKYTTTNNWWEGTSVTLTDTAAAFEFRSSKTNGMSFGGDTADKISFYGVTPGIVQPSGAAQAALTDNTTGTAGTTLAAGVGVSTITLPITLASITGTGDVVTTYTPGYKFKILAVDFVTEVAVTTGSKAATLNLEIGTTNLTGGVLSLTSATATPIGAIIAGTAVSGNNTGTASDTISVESSAVTAFSEGAGYILVKIQNMDTADAVASVANLADEGIRAALVALGLIKGSA